MVAVGAKVVEERAMVDVVLARPVPVVVVEVETALVLVAATVVVVTVVVVDVVATAVVVEATEDEVVEVSEDFGDAQYTMWLMPLSPFLPPGSEMPFRLTSAKTAIPGPGLLKRVFTWNAGSVVVREPALTITVVYSQFVPSTPGT